MDIDRRVLRFSVAAAGLAVLLILFGFSSIWAQNPIKEVLDRMDAHYKSLSSLRSDVTMYKKNSQIGSRDTYEGSTSYLPKTGKRAMYIRVDWVKPAQESMVVIGEEYKLYRPKLGQAIVGKTSNAKNSGAAGGALVFLSMSKEQLKANYTIRYVGVEEISGGTSTWHLELTPKTAASYKTAELWVDTDGLPRQATVTEKNDDTTTVLLKNIQKNIVIKPDSFILTWPKATEVIKS